MAITSSKSSTEPAHSKQMVYTSHAKTIRTKIIAGLFLEQDTAIAAQTMQLNYFGTHNVIKAVLPQMVQQNQGHIVLISSGVALAGKPYVK